VQLHQHTDFRKKNKELAYKKYFGESVQDLQQLPKFEENMII